MDAKTLALYLGCETNVGKLVGITERNCLIEFRSQARIVRLDFSEIKLLLRPLSSMTEEESKTYRELHDKLFEDGCLNGEAWAQLTVHLLSKGFDLFGLIEKGDALDATKVEKLNEI